MKNRRWHELSITLLLTIAACVATGFAQTPGQARVVAEIRAAGDLIAKGYPQAAIASLDKTIKSYPNSSDAYAERATGYWELSNLASALADADKAISLNADNAAAYSIRSAVTILKSSAEKGSADQKTAVDLADKAIARDPKDAESYYRRGAIVAKISGQTDRAIADLTKAIDLDPSFARAYQARGYLYFTRATNITRLRPILQRPANCGRDR